MIDLEMAITFATQNIENALAVRRDAGYVAGSWWAAEYYMRVAGEIIVDAA
jgi:hypothetical protein